MRDLLETLAAGETSVDAVEAALVGYATGEAGRFDAARERRRGIPEAILAAGKSPTEVATLATTAVETTGRALVTRTTPAVRETVRDGLTRDHADVEITVHKRADLLVAHAPDFDRPDIDATVGVVTAGTADAGPADEAAAIAREIGATVVRVNDVGVANLTRIVDRLDDLRATDVLVVAAGREGALPTVVAGLVDVPVIGLPISTGYGHGGEGEAALTGMLQSCTVLSTVNVDAGFVAGAQAGLIARSVAAAREKSGG